MLLTASGQLLVSSTSLRFTIACFYRRPSDRTLTGLCDWLSSITQPNVTIMGNLNMAHISWTNMQIAGHTDRMLQNSLLQINKENSMSHHINIPTHTKENRLDSDLKPGNQNHPNGAKHIRLSRYMAFSISYSCSKPLPLWTTLPQKRFCDLKQCLSREISHTRAQAEPKNEYANPQPARHGKNMASIQRPAIPLKSRRASNKPWIT